MESLLTKIAGNNVCGNAIDASSEFLAFTKVEFTFGRMS